MKLLIIVKTYPCSSKKYNELVCTAGLTESGDWVRVYPIDFRSLKRNQKYRKYQWIEVECIKDTSDPRKESYKVVGEIKPLDTICTCNNWKYRKEILLQNIYFSKEKLLESYKNEGTSLAIFKPSMIKSFEIIEGVKALDYKFYYKFSDDKGNYSKLRIIDWEIYQLTRKLLAKYKENTPKIKEILKQKYFGCMKKRDVYLFLGTSRKWHIRRAKNPFMIIGIFYPPL